MSSFFKNHLDLNVIQKSRLLFIQEVSIDILTGALEIHLTELHRTDIVTSAKSNQCFGETMQGSSLD